MDFQHNTQPDGINEQTPAQESPLMPQQTLQDQQINTAEQGVQDRPINTAEPGLQEQPMNTAESGLQEQSITQGQPYQEQPIPQSHPMQQQEPFENRNMQTPGGNPYNHNPYENRTNPYQNGQSYQQNQPYQNNIPYGNGYPNNSYYNNNPNRGNNAYPYYNRDTYQVPYAEPGSKLANAAMVLGIISIIASFTFTVYPAFILGSIAIILALLSKGGRTSFFQKARTGIICGTIGLITNAAIIIISLVFVFTNPDAREMFDQIFEQQYGMSFEEMMEEMNNGTFGE